jgi:hypothetical protein
MTPIVRPETVTMVICKTLTSVCDQGGAKVKSDWIVYVIVKTCLYINEDDSYNRLCQLTLEVMTAVEMNLIVMWGCVFAAGGVH